MVGYAFYRCACVFYQPVVPMVQRCDWRPNAYRSAREYELYRHPFTASVLRERGIALCNSIRPIWNFPGFKYCRCCHRQYYSADDKYKAPVRHNIISFPPFIALLIASCCRWLEYPEWLNEVLPRMAQTLVPVVMAAVGLQWRLRLDRKHLQPLTIGLVYLMLLSPLFAWALLKMLTVEGLVAKVIILEAAMPSMISAGVLATSHHLAPKLTAPIVGNSITIGIFSVWLWHQALS